MDSRFHMKVEFQIYGKKFTHECSLNWTETYDGGIDRRITEMFQNWHDEAKGEWDAKLLMAQEDEARARTEIVERREYERLKVKFDPAIPQQGDGE